MHVVDSLLSVWALWVRAVKCNLYSTVFKMTSPPLYQSTPCCRLWQWTPPHPTDVIICRHLVVMESPRTHNSWVVWRCFAVQSDCIHVQISPWICNCPSSLATAAPSTDEHSVCGQCALSGAHFVKLHDSLDQTVTWAFLELSSIFPDLPQPKMSAQLLYESVGDRIFIFLRSWMTSCPHLCKGFGLTFTLNLWMTLIEMCLWENPDPASVPLSKARTLSSPCANCFCLVIDCL